MRRPSIPVRLALSAVVLLASQFASGSRPQASAAARRAIDGASLTQSLSPVFIAASSDSGAKLLPARRDQRSPSSTTRAIWLLASAGIVAAIRLLFLAADSHGWKLRFLVVGRSVPTRAPPAFQLA
jgi:hypothetical protein